MNTSFVTWINRIALVVGFWGFLAVGAAYLGSVPVASVGPAEMDTERLLADYTFWLMVFTGILGLSTILLWWETRSGGQIAAKALIVANRPWVAVEDISIATPLTYDPDGTARITFNFLVKNTGNSPAINIQVNSVFFPGGPLRNEIDELIKARKRAQEAPEIQGRTVVGHSLFPNSSTTIPCNVIIPKHERDAAFEGIAQVDYFNPYLVGCISYRFAFESGRHITDFNARLMRHTQSRAFQEAEGEVPVDQMSLVRSFIGGIAD